MRGSFRQSAESVGISAAAIERRTGPRPQGLRARRRVRLPQLPRRLPVRRISSLVARISCRTPPVQPWRPLDYARAGVARDSSLVGSCGTAKYAEYAKGVLVEIQTARYEIRTYGRAAANERRATKYGRRPRFRVHIRPARIALSYVYSVGSVSGLRIPRQRMEAGDQRQQVQNGFKR